MADITADTGRIRDCSNSLWQVYNAFTNHANPLDGYDSAALGEKNLVHVFSDFAHNWKIHREGLAEKIQTLGQILETAADTYDRADAALAAALRTTDRQVASEGGH
ncbi:hypothetical protein [Catenulispora pinisilvae]|uniref:hypothetical protein n=1 Tax=Catenulispora pinisilvae TaxID=2705253 RepID=UPI001890EDDA|nr:hypothetical protein [Catenulispora pinisilvae]